MMASNEIKTLHPMLMVARPVTMSVMVYTNGGPCSIDADAVRRAIIAACPPGTGVGDLQVCIHGVL